MALLAFEKVPVTEGGGGGGGFGRGDGPGGGPGGFGMLAIDMEWSYCWSARLAVRLFCCVT
jgi:hypothetical protein